MPDTYELHFRIQKPTEEQLERVEEVADLLYAAHGGFYSLTLWQAGSSALDAGKKAIALLDQEDITVLHLVDDLVTRQDIAERLNVTRQAVSNWIRGSRRGPGISLFPPPANPAGGGLWIWQDINLWAQGTDGTDMGICHLGLMENAQINAWLSSQQRLTHAA